MMLTSTSDGFAQPVAAAALASSRMRVALASDLPIVGDVGPGDVGPGDVGTDSAAASGAMVSARAWRYPGTGGKPTTISRPNSNGQHATSTRRQAITACSSRAGLA